jgi:putative membrane protein
VSGTGCRLHIHLSVNPDSPATNILTGAAVGTLAGVVGAFLMVRFQNAVMNATSNGNATADVPKHREPGHPERKEQADASAQVADTAVELVTGKHLDREQRKRGGEIVHYAFGAGAGAVYGALAKLTAEDAESIRGTANPEARATANSTATAKAVAGGVAYGLGIWMAFDLVILPAMGLSPKPQEQAPGRLALGAAGHAVYGATLGAALGRILPGFLPRSEYPVL